MALLGSGVIAVHSLPSVSIGLNINICTMKSSHIMGKFKHDTYFEVP